MKSRTAAICAAVSLSAALNVSSKPFSAEKAVFIDSVFALRQPDSEPVCAKPTVMGPSSAGVAAVAARTGAACRDKCQRCQQGTAGEELLLHVHQTSSFGSGTAAGLDQHGSVPVS